MNWSINSSCEWVTISSRLFKIEDEDYLLINGQRFHVGHNHTSMIVPGNSDIQFRSDDFVTDAGFILEWKCVHLDGKSYNEPDCGMFHAHCIADF